jgi:predicted ATPase/ribosome-binding protein aMBF1 (putative translation factor)
VSHPFGDLVSQHLHRKHGLSQSRLAAGIGQAPAVISRMCRGERLTGPQARDRVLAIVGWLHRQGALATLDEANALLNAAGMAPLSRQSTLEAALAQALQPLVDEREGESIHFRPPFGRWLQGRRQRLDLTQGDLARRINYSPETIRKIEAGVLRPSKQMADLLADHLGIPSSQRDAFLAFASHERIARPSTQSSALSIPTTPLIGREHDVSAALDMLRRRNVRLVTLVGSPGVGKTRLAIELARIAQETWNDGATFVELASISDPELVGATIVRAYGIKDDFGRSPLESLKAYLHDKHALLALDNFEHVSSSASLVHHVLSAAPHVKFLITSREPLHLTGEHRFIVAPLALPRLQAGVAPSEAMAVVAQSPAVEVFVQRAKAVLPSFALNESNATTVAAICRKLDGLPLALELAAPRITLLSPEELLVRLNRQLDVLTSGPRDLPARQRTLRATIDWSYSLLSPSEQVLFRRLAVFSGGCTLEAIEVVCRLDSDWPTSTVDGIAVQVSKNLLTKMEVANGSTRYRMLELIREYALEKLTESGEADAVRLRHAEYFEGLVQASITRYLSIVEAESVRRIQPELDNLRAAVVWSMTTPDHAETGLRLIPAIFACALIWGGLDAEWSQLNRMSAHLQGAKRTIAWAVALEAIARSLGVLGEYATAYQLLLESLHVSRELQDEAHVARFLVELGRLARERDDMPRARAHLDEFIELCRRLGDTLGLAGGLVTLAEVAVMEEDSIRATALLSESMAISEQHGYLGTLAWSINHLGHAAMLQGDDARAIALHEQSLPLMLEIGQLMGPAHAHESLAAIAFKRGDAAGATSHLIESLSYFRRLGDRMGIAWCLAGFAGVAALNEDPERAALLWGAGEELRQKIGCRIAPASRMNREQIVARLHEQLGEARFEAEQMKGRKMTLEQAIDYALADA